MIALHITELQAKLLILTLSDARDEGPGYDGGWKSDALKALEAEINQQVSEQAD